MNPNIHSKEFLSITFAHRWQAGALLTLAFAGGARVLRGVTNSGAIAGSIVCFLLYLGGGPGAFATLIAVFALAWISTRVGYHRKLQLGIAEQREGRRASQVFANLSIAAVCALSYPLSHERVWLLASVAALAEAAADTVSSEIGQVGSATARLITNWEPVEAGTDGAVSLLGSSAGFTAALLVCATAAFFNLIPFTWIGVPMFAAMVGMLGDSLLGAALERRRMLNNDSVNLLGTLIAAVVAMLSHGLFA